MQVELVAHADPQKPSGIGRYTRELYRHLINRINVRIALPHYLPLSDRFTILKNFPLGVVDHQAGSTLHFTQIMGCAQMLWNPVHPSIATVHDLGVLVCEEDRELFNRLDRKILDLHLRGLRRVDVVATDSEFTRQSVIEHLGLPQNKVITVFPGIDLVGIDSRVKYPISLVDRFPILNGISHPWLLYVGSELPRKNTLQLLDILVELRKSLPGARLIKIGASGGEKYRIQMKARIDALGLEDCVLFFDQVTEAELYAFYREADVLVHPSKLEGFGFPVLEAFACELPVTCSNAGSLPEIAGESAILHDPFDTTGFVTSVQKVYGDLSFRDRLVSSGKNWVRRFSWQKTVDSMENVYRIAAERG